LDWVKANGAAASCSLGDILAPLFQELLLGKEAVSLLAWRQVGFDLLEPTKVAIINVRTILAGARCGEENTRTLLPWLPALRAGGAAQTAVCFVILGHGVVKYVEALAFIEGEINHWIPGILCASAANGRCEQQGEDSRAHRVSACVKSVAVSSAASVGNENGPKRANKKSCIFSEEVTEILILSKKKNPFPFSPFRQCQCVRGA
jgi:hypothetical protein